MSVQSGVLETRDLKLVRAIATAGGATRAAKQLHLSQSAVSHQLRGLEERLGVALFERLGRRLQITPAGQKLVDVADQVLAPLLQAEIELRRGVGVERPKLRVATQCYTAYHWLPQALKALFLEHPEIELSLQSGSLGDAAEPLLKDEVDLVLCVLPPRNPALTRVPLFKDELVLAVPRGHALARKPYVDGRDLTEQTLIQSDISALARDHVRKIVFPTGVSPAHVLRLPVSEAVLDLVQAGMGVSIVAGFTLGPRLERGDLAAVRLTRRGFPRPWTGVFRKGSRVAGPIRTVLKILQRFEPPRKTS
jgi:LysR family transcriptional regulator, regulator for metE and metH